MLSGSLRVMSGPPFSSLIECRTVAHIQGKVIEAHHVLVEPSVDPLRVRHESDVHPAWVEHAPDPEPRVLDFDHQPEAQYFGPPSSAPLAVGDGEVDVPKTFDSGCGHA